MDSARNVLRDAVDGAIEVDQHSLVSNKALVEIHARIARELNLAIHNAVFGARGNQT